MRFGNVDVQLLVYPKPGSCEDIADEECIPLPVTIVTDSDTGEASTIFHAPPGCFYRVRVTALQDTITGNFPQENFLAFLSIDGVNVGYSKIFDLTDQVKTSHTFDGFRKDVHHWVAFKFQETLMETIPRNDKHTLIRDRRVSSRKDGQGREKKKRRARSKSGSSSRHPSDEENDVQSIISNNDGLGSTSHTPMRNIYTPISTSPTTAATVPMFSATPSIKRKIAPITPRGSDSCNYAFSTTTIEDFQEEHQSSSPWKLVPIVDKAVSNSQSTRYPIFIDLSEPNEYEIKQLEIEQPLCSNRDICNPNEDGQVAAGNASTNRAQAVDDDDREDHKSSCNPSDTGKEIPNKTSKRRKNRQKKEDARGSIVLKFYEAQPRCAADSIPSKYQPMGSLNQQLIERIEDDKLWDHPSVTTATDEETKPLVFNTIHWKRTNKIPFQTIKIYYHAPEVLDLWQMEMEEEKQPLVFTKEGKTYCWLMSNRFIADSHSVSISASQIY